MFDGRYGHLYQQARGELVAAVRPPAEHVATLLRDNPVPRTTPFPLADIHRQLAEQNTLLQAAIGRFSLQLAINAATGNPDQLGAAIATLTSSLTHAVVLYQGLDEIPERLFGKIHREFEALLGAANAVVIHTRAQ